MNEILSPAGTIESFHAAISNGCNAIYLGLDKYSARAYANNFTIEKLKELVSFAHLRNVKIYVTINTIIYDHELNDVYECIDELANIGIDAIIVQDLAILNYITNKYESIKVHCSTQMGIDDLDGAILAEKLGATRIVYARETPLDTIKNIKNNLDIESEVFVHGALCVSYSGNCFMSSSIGERSGNRGRCAGCCRKVYTLIDKTKNVSIKQGYLLSMKDLNVTENINKMRFIDSFKIEGRMKEPSYVASVTRHYRSLIDNTNFNKDNILKVFNRTYTKGFINNENINNITNIDRPNNYGYLIGEVTKVNKGKIYLKLYNKKLNKGDQIRIESDDLFNEISIPVLRLYNLSFNQVDHLNKFAIVESNKCVKVGAKVYKTKDIEYLNDIEETLNTPEYKKLDIDMELNCHIGKPIFLKVQYQQYKSFIKSDYIVEESLTSNTTDENIYNQLNRLNDTPYKLRNLTINKDENIFIPLKLLNELRRKAIDDLNNSRLQIKVITKDILPIKVKEYEIKKVPEISVEVQTLEQYNLVKELGIKHIYFDNIIRRNNAKYLNYENQEILVGGLGGINHYKNTNNQLVSDYSMNVVNHKTVAILSNLGVDRITLSQEINKENIKNLINLYIEEYHTYPNLELIIYGKSKIRHTIYCVLNRLGMCGKCKESKFELKDEFESFPLIFNDDCTMTILNSKTLNFIDDIDNLTGINYYRLVFMNESLDQIKAIITILQNKLNNINKSIKIFNKETDTRGHFNKNPL